MMLENTEPFMGHPFTTEGIDISERSHTADGRELRLDRRLFMQLQVFGGCTDTGVLIDALEQLLTSDSASPA